jgi:uncharacterized protein (TIGR02611 family)
VLKLAAILRFIRRSTVLLGVGLLGGTVTTAGFVMLITPGPGLVVIIAGLAILATQFAWAERALQKMKQRALAARDKAAARRADRRTAAADAAAADADTSEPSTLPQPPPPVSQPAPIQPPRTQPPRTQPPRAQPDDIPVVDRDTRAAG